MLKLHEISTHRVPCTLKTQVLLAVQMFEHETMLLLVCVCAKIGVLRVCIHACVCACVSSNNCVCVFCMFVCV